MTNRVDNCTRANSSTTPNSPSDGGSDWVVHSETFGIASNMIYKVTNGTGVIGLPSGVTAVEADLTIGYTSFTDLGVAARIADASNYLLLYATPTAMQMYKNVAGSLTQLGSTFSGTISVGDVLMIRCDSADAITCYQNGVARVGPVTETAGNGNTQHGVRMGGTGALSFVSLFHITEIVAGGSVVPVLMRQYRQRRS